MSGCLRNYSYSQVIAMKLLAKRALVLLVLVALLTIGLVCFVVRYFNQASTWVQYPANKHLFNNQAKLTVSGTIYDRSGQVLLEMVDGVTKYHRDKTVRTAMLHATGDTDNNIAVGAQVAFREHIIGWNLLNGVYRLQNQPNRSANLTLTLDANLCAAAYKALNGRKGAVGVYNYQTGEILCMVSAPSFDPEQPPNISHYPEKYEGVYINRLLSAVYPPGSIFKIVTAAAALENLPEDKLYHCEGKMQIGSDTVTCTGIHGDIALEQALAHSCNAAFAQIALELGDAVLQKYANLAGFNSYLVVDGIKTAVGRVDVRNAAAVDLAWAGIGQYTNTANPLNFMAFMGAIANQGVLISPRLIADNYGFFASSQKKQVLSAETAVKLGALMRNNTLSVYGEYNFKGLELCPKSGTAEVGEGKRPHAWFTGFLAREDYPLAFVVLIENGGIGSQTAASVARRVLQTAVSTGK